MKKSLITLLLLAVSGVAVPAFADNNSANAQPQAAGVVKQKTRAQVYQELVSAEKSGELARENLTYLGGR